MSRKSRDFVLQHVMCYKNGGGGGGGGGSGQKISYNIVPELEDGIYNISPSDISLMNMMGDEDGTKNAKLLGVATEYNYYKTLEDKWVRDVDGDAKSEAADMLRKNSSLRMAILYDGYVAEGSQKKFRDWIEEPVAVYRAGAILGDAPSFAFSKSVAEQAAKQKVDYSIKIPRKRLLSYTASGAGEVWIDTSTLK